MKWFGKKKKEQEDQVVVSKSRFADFSITDLQLAHDILKNFIKFGNENNVGMLENASREIRNEIVKRVLGCVSVEVVSQEDIDKAFNR